MPNSSWASITSRPLFISVLESIVIFGPIDHVGWASASSTRHVGELGGRAAAERAAAGREQQPGDLAVRRRPTSAGTGARRSARCRPAPARRPASPAAAARPGRRRSGSPCWPGPAACPGRSVAIVTGRPAKPTTALTTTSACSTRSARSSTTVANGQRGGDLGPPGRVADGDDARAGTPWPASMSDVDRRADAEGDDLVARRLGADDVERLRADRAGRAGDGDA